MLRSTELPADHLIREKDMQYLLSSARPLADDPKFHAELIQKGQHFIYDANLAQKSAPSLDLKQKISSWLNGELVRLNLPKDFLTYETKQRIEYLLWEYAVPFVPDSGPIGSLNYARGDRGISMLSDLEFEEAFEECLVHPQLLTSAVIYFTNDIYRDLAVFLVAAADKKISVRARHLFIRNIAIVGMLLGYLDDDCPGVESRRQLFRTYLDKSLVLVPPILESEIWKESKNSNTKPFKMLQKFWQSVFVANLASTDADMHNSSLNAQDSLILRRQRKDPPGIQSQAVAMTVAANAAEVTGSVRAGQAIMDESARSRSMVELSKAQSRSSVLRAWHEIHIAYGTKNNLSQAERVVEKDALLKAIAETVLATFVKTGVQIGNSSPRPTWSHQEFDQILAAMSQKLAFGTKSFDDISKAIFGDNFPSLSSAEKVGLLIYGSLVFVREGQLKRLAIQLISHKLSPALGNYDLNLDQTNKAGDRNLEFVQEDLGLAREKAVQRLYILDQDGGILSSDGKKALTYGDIVRAGISDFPDMMKNVHKLDPLLLPYYEMFFTFMSALLSAGNFYGLYLLAVDKSDFLSLATIALLTLFSKLLMNIATTNNLVMKYGAQMRSLKVALVGQRKIDQEIDRIEKELEEETDRKKKQQSMFSLAASVAGMVGLLVGLNSRQQKLPPIEDLSSPPTLVSPNFSESELPDRLSMENLQRLELKSVSQIYHLPDGVSPVDGQSLGFTTRQTLDVMGAEVLPQPTGVLIEDESVMSINQDTHESKSNELVYSPTVQSTTLYPPDGYVIVKIYRVGGTRPQAGIFGELIFDQASVPSKLLVVAAKIDAAQTIDHKIESSETLQYKPWETWESQRQQAILLNQQLSSDQDLQNLHLEMISRFDELVDDVSRAEASDQEKAARFSSLIEEFVLKYKLYTESHRYYSLKFPETNYDDALVVISQNPALGYYCSLGNIAFAQFFESMGVRVLNRSGANLFYRNDNMVFRYGHMNSVVITPDGSLVFSDLTPKRPMPNEDLSILNLDVDEEPLSVEPVVSTSRNWLASTSLAGLVGLGFVGLSSAGLLADKLKRSRVKRKGAISELAGHDLEKLALRVAVEHDLRATHLVLNSLEYLVMYLESAFTKDGKFIMASHLSPDAQAFCKQIAADTVVHMKGGITKIDSSPNSSPNERISALSEKLTKLLRRPTSGQRTLDGALDIRATLIRNTLVSVNSELSLLLAEKIKSTNSQIEQLKIELAQNAASKEENGRSSAETLQRINKLSTELNAYKNALTMLSAVLAAAMKKKFRRYEDK